MGENGAGKTTLLKILLGELTPVSGLRHGHRNLRIGYFSQHHVDQLDLNLNSVEVLAAKLPGKTRTTRMPAFWGYSPSPHDYPFCWFTLDPKSKEDKVKFTNYKNLPKFQIFEFWHKLYTRHTIWTCLIRCTNMKWIRQILLKIQSGHGSVHTRTDRQTRWNQYTPPFKFVEVGGIMIQIYLSV